MIWFALSLYRRSFGENEAQELCGCSRCRRCSCPGVWDTRGVWEIHLQFASKTCVRSHKATQELVPSIQICHQVSLFLKLMKFLRLLQIYKLFGAKKKNTSTNLSSSGQNSSTYVVKLVRHNYSLCSNYNSFDFFPLNLTTSYSQIMQNIIFSMCLSLRRMHEDKYQHHLFGILYQTAKFAKVRCCVVVCTKFVFFLADVLS